MVRFKILHKNGKARVGQLKTAHGVIETPNFIPVGTQASVKAISPKDLKELGAQIVLTNTYHLMLRPGADLIEKLGGLHKFMSWDKPIMTDSGGFQVFSLGIGLESGEGKVLKSIPNLDPSMYFHSASSKIRLAKVTEEGVTFQSHLDGSKHFLGPQESIRIQHQLGADLIVAFDDHESITMTKKEIEKSLELTKEWGLRSLAEYQRLCHSEAKPKNIIRSFAGAQDDREQLLYGVVHGALFKDLRVLSAKFTDKHFNAIAIGGIYGTKFDLYQLISWVLDKVSDEKVRHLLGIGEVEDLFNGVERGVDLFDCVAPMRRARFGSIYISPKNGGSVSNSFVFNLRMGKYKDDKKQLDPGCQCYSCQNFSRAYLRHLYMAEEILYHQLATYHNVYFIINLMKNIREVIKAGKFDFLRNDWLKN